jgi:phosphoribosyl 1,2-cyclic phosphodiesterase
MLYNKEILYQQTKQIDIAIRTVDFLTNSYPVDRVSLKMSMIAISLQSGSTGNCIYVEASGVKLLFDAGISGIRVERRLAEQGRNIQKMDAVIISHDHIDHVRYAGVYQRKYHIPLYISPKTLDAAIKRFPLGRLKEIHHFQPGSVLSFGPVSVETIATPHDCIEGSAFVISSGEKRLGILTDLGHAFEGLDRIIASLDAVFIESNYDPRMLASGPYPTFLKRRIKGPGGHLSNIEAAELLRISCGRLKWACLSHLSEQNNHADVALQTHRNMVNPNLTLHAAGRYAATVALVV